MNSLFQQLLSLSKVISIMIVVVIMLRLLLNKAPKKIHKLMWMIVGIRACIPFSFKSSFAILPSDSVAITISDSGIVRTEPVVGRIVERVGATAAESATTGTGTDSLLFYVWLAGIAGFALYMLVNYVRTRQLVSTASLEAEGIYSSDRIPSPFIIGCLRPRIYILPHMGQNEKELIVAHEMCHIRNRDHILKLIGFVTLGIYWFNPLMWLAYYLFCKDIELSCDEEVIKSLTFVKRKEYALALLNSAHNAGRFSYGTAFSENNVKERVVSVMNYKKPRLLIMITAVAACAVMMFMFFTVGKAKGQTLPEQNDLITYEFETFEGETIVIDAENIISQEAVEDVLETDKVPADAEIIAPGRDYVYLADDSYIYVEDAANGLLTVAEKKVNAADSVETSEAVADYQGEDFGFRYNPDYLFLFEDETGVNVSYYREDVDLAGSNVITLTTHRDTDCEELIKSKVSELGGDPAEIKELETNDSVDEAYVYSSYADSAETELKTGQILYSIKIGDKVILADEFRTIGPDEDLELDIDAKLGLVIQSIHA